MTTMTGTHTFDLDCHYLYASSRVMGMQIIVDYSVEVWRNGSAVEMSRVTPETVVLIVGRTEMGSIDFDDLAADLRYFVETESKTLDLAGLGIEEEEAQDWIACAEDQEAFEREHAAGRV